MRYLLALAFTLFAASASAQSSGVMGTWLTQAGTAQVKIGPCADAAQGPLCGVVVGLINPKNASGQPVAPEAVTDSHNPDPAMRSRKMLGLPLFWGFKATSNPNTFEDGKIYNGENGKTYSANISLQADGKLRLRGFVGSPMFGETQLWTRIGQ